MYLVNSFFIFVVIFSFAEAVDWVYFSNNYKVLPKPHLRIIGGNETTPHEYPFQVGLMIDGSAFCGGTLISPNYVLTAAHCAIAIYSKVEVILGAHNIKTNERSQVHIRGEKIIIHEQYNRTSFENDVALIQLARPAPLNNVIKTVTLATRADAQRTFTNVKAISIGWGLIHDVPYPSIHDISSVLMALNVSVTPLAECLEFNENDNNIIYVTDKNVCTSGYKAIGTCEGDSGSPLLYEGRQIGMVSIGPTQCEACWPSVYTHVGKFLDWIESHSDVVLQE